MREVSFLLFLIQCVLCRPNSEGNVIQRETTVASLPNDTNERNLIYPYSQKDHAALNEGQISPHTWNAFGRNGVVAPLYPGQISYSPAPMPPFFIPAPLPPPQPMLLPPSPIIGFGSTYPAVGAPIIELIPPQSIGTIYGQPLLFPSGPIRGPLGGYYIPVTATTTTIQTEEVSN